MSKSETTMFLKEWVCNVLTFRWLTQIRLCSTYGMLLEDVTLLCTPHLKYYSDEVGKGEWERGLGCGGVGSRNLRFRGSGILGLGFSRARVVGLLRLKF